MARILIVDDSPSQLMGMKRIVEKLGHEALTAEDGAAGVEAAKANNLANFSSYLERMLDELFIDRMEGNEEIFSRVMTDKEFRSAAHEHLARELYERLRTGNASPR